MLKRLFQPKPTNLYWAVFVFFLLSCVFASGQEIVMDPLLTETEEGLPPSDLGRFLAAEAKCLEETRRSRSGYAGRRGNFTFCDQELIQKYGDEHTLLTYDEYVSRDSVAAMRSRINWPAFPFKE